MLSENMTHLLIIKPEKKTYTNVKGQLSMPKAELPILSHSAERSLKINLSFYVLKNKFENLLDYGHFVPIMLNVVLNISLIVVQNLLDYGNSFVECNSKHLAFLRNLPDCKMQTWSALLQKECHV